MSRIRIIFAVVFALCCPLLKAQDEAQLDRIETLLQLACDSVKCEMLYEEGFSLRVTHPQLSWKLAQEMISCADFRKSETQKAKAYNLCGILLYRSGDYKSARKYHLDALAIRQRYMDENACAQSFTNLGNVCSDLGDFTAAQSYHLSALRIFRNAGNEKQILNCLTNLGIVDHYRKNTAAAQGNFNAALQLAEKLNDVEAQAMICNNLATMYEDNKDYSVAEGYYIDCMKLREQMDNQAEVADSYLSLGLLNVLRGENQEALSWLEKSRLIAEKFSYTSTWKKAVEALADVYSEAGNFKMAYECLKAKEKIPELTEPKKIPLTIPTVAQVGEKPASGRMYYLIIGFLCCVIIFLTVGKRVKSDDHERQEEKKIMRRWDLSSVQIAI